MIQRQAIDNMMYRLKICTRTHKGGVLTTNISEDENNVILSLMIGTQNHQFPFKLIIFSIMGLSDSDYEQITDLVGSLEQVATAYIEGV